MKNPPTNAEDRGSLPGAGRSHRPQGNSAHVLQPLNPKATEPANHHYGSAHALESVLRNKRTAATGSPGIATKHSPCWQHLETVCGSSDPVQPETKMQIKK